MVVSCPQLNWPLGFSAASRKFLTSNPSLPSNFGRELSWLPDAGWFAILISGLGLLDTEGVGLGEGVGDWLEAGASPRSCSGSDSDSVELSLSTIVSLPGSSWVSWYSSSSEGIGVGTLGVFVL